MSDTERIVLPTGIGLGVSVRGDGPAVLLNAGLGMPKATWDYAGVTQALVDAGFRVISYSARGVKPSDAPPPPYRIAELADDAALLLDHLGVGSAAIVGYSMGCYVTQALLERRPGTARGIVLCAGLASSEIGKLVNEMELGLFERLGEVPKTVAAFETMMTTLAPADLQNGETVRVWHEMLMHGESSWSNKDGQHGQLAASQAWMLDGEPTRERLSAIDVPALVIAYENDLFFPPATSRAAAEIIGAQGAEFLQINGLSHGGLMLDPDRTATARIVEFCCRVAES